MSVNENENVKVTTLETSKGQPVRTRIFLATLFLAACTSSGTEPDADGWRRVVGLVQPQLSSIQAIKFPADIVAGEPFTVTITTLGSSSCTRADGAVLNLSSSLAVITPYDRVAPDGTGCTRDLRAFPRDVSVTLSRAGQATIRIVARDSDSSTLTYDANITVRAR